MARFDFVWQGVHFAGNSHQPFVIFSRYPGQRRAVRSGWHDMDSFVMPKTAKHVFNRAADMFTKADVYCVNTNTGTVVAHAHQENVLFDWIDPAAIIDHRPVCEKHGNPHDDTPEGRPDCEWCGIKMFEPGELDREGQG